MCDLEKDLDNQFKEKLMNAIKHLSEMYDIADIPRVRAAAAISANCLGIAIGIAAIAGMSRKDILEEVGKFYDGLKQREKNV